MEDNTNIKLITKEGKEIEVSKKAIELSDLLKNAEKIKEYLTHFNGIAPPEIEKPLSNNEMKNVTDEWSAGFINKLTIEELVNLTVAANYMGINSLLDLCSAKIASLCKDKNEEEIFKTFGINEPFTEEEKKKIKEENKWIDENL